ncbi:MAG: helix-turn-helix domain-containing protein, partial [Thermoplasmata archaeon]
GNRRRKRLSINLAIPCNMVEPQKILAGEASCRDIVKCMYSLSDFELIIYKKLVKQGPLKADDLAPVLKKDRSTVYRALQKLVASGLAFREIKTIDRGGYYHVYSAASPEQLKEKLHKCADDWFENMNSAIDDFDLV